MRATTASRLLLSAFAAFAAALAIASPRGALAEESKVKPAAAPAAPVDTGAQDLAMAQAAEDSLVKAVAAVRESSVSVFNYQVPAGGEAPRPVVTGASPREPASREPVLVGCGSGVIYAVGGKPYVITNEHVIKGAALIKIKGFDGIEREVTLKDHVPPYDIALLDFAEKDRPKSYKGAKVGNSRRVSSANPGGLSEGQWVIATGNPFFLATDGRCVVTLGVVSGLDRILPGEFEYANAIQHDAEVNPGNSGGPLWTLKGELIGINGKIASRGDGGSVTPSNTGASFSVPIHLIQQYLPALVDDHVKAAAGYLGLACESAIDKAGQPIGAKVVSLAADCPCGRRPKDPKDVGLASGDVIQRISVLSGKTTSYEIRSASDYTNALVLLLAGTKVRVSYARGTKNLSWVGEMGALGGGK